MLLRGNRADNIEDDSARGLISQREKGPRHSQAWFQDCASCASTVTRWCSLAIQIAVHSASVRSRAARPGSAAASARATADNARALQSGWVIAWAISSAWLGLVSASAFAFRHSR